MSVKGREVISACFSPTQMGHIRFKVIDMKSVRVYMTACISYWWVAMYLEVDHRVKGTI